MLYLSGPLVCFEGLLSLYGHEVKMVNDMIVAIEDLRSVEFTLIPVEKRASRKAARCRRGDPAARVGGAGAPAGGGSVAPAGGEGAQAVVTYSVSSFPLPRVTGSRSHLKGTPPTGSSLGYKCLRISGFKVWNCCG